jgi:hypothetical protein
VNPRDIKHYDKPIHLVRQAKYDMRMKGFVSVESTYPFIRAHAPQVLVKAIKGYSNREGGIKFIEGYFAPAWIVHLAGFIEFKPLVRRSWIEMFQRDPDELKAFEAAKVLGVDIRDYFRDKGMFTDRDGSRYGSRYRMGKVTLLDHRYQCKVDYLP